MLRLQALVFGLGIGAAVAAPVAAADPPFDVKPGLWQMTASVTTNGAPPIPPEAIASLSPEERAKIEAAVKAAMARAAQPHVGKACFTVDQLRQIPDFTRGIKWSCKQTVVTRTPTEIKTNAVCSDPVQGTMSGTFHITALNQETIAAATDFTRSTGGQTIKMQQKVSGKWLGSDCGEMKQQKTP